MAEKLRKMLQQNGVDANTIQKVETQVSQAQNTGQKLGPNAQQLMQMAGETFGADFSNVRVHSDSQSNSMSNSIGAQAFTQGNHVHFKSWSTSGDADRQLLKQEMAHTIQQGPAKPADFAQQQQVKQMAEKAAKGH